MGVPRYTVIRQEGPDHDRTFTVEVFLRNERKGFGQGKNKKEAEQAAAGDALQGLL
jgi:ribonuclease-3